MASRSGRQEVQVSHFLSQAVRKRDAAALAVEASANDVSLFRFDVESSRWISSQLEGSLYFYRRNGAQGWGLLLLARDSVNCWNETFGSDVELQLRPPFLLYRSCQDKVGDGVELTGKPPSYRIQGLRLAHKEACVELYESIRASLVRSPPPPPSADSVKHFPSPRKPFLYERQMSQPMADRPSTGGQSLPGQTQSQAQTQAALSPMAYLNLSTCSSQSRPSTATLLDVNEASNHLRQFLRLSADSAPPPPPPPPPVASSSLTNGHDNTAEKFVRDVTEKLKAIARPETEGGEPELRSPRDLDFDLPVLLLPDDLDKIQPSSAPTLVDQLNKDQMVQALHWLLENDDQFVDKLHHAYQQSQRS